MLQRDAVCCSLLYIIVLIDVRAVQSVSVLQYGAVCSMYAFTNVRVVLCGEVCCSVV